MSPHSSCWWPSSLFHHFHSLHHHHRHHHHHEHQHHTTSTTDHDDDHHHHQDLLKKNQTEKEETTVTFDYESSTLCFSSSSPYSSSSSSTSSCSHIINNNMDDIIDNEKHHRRRHRHVSFYPQVKQYDHIHKSDYTTDEKQKTWYNRYELHRIQKDNERTIHWMISFNNHNNNNKNQGRQQRQENEEKQQVKEEEEEYYSCRGLEYMTPLGSKAKYNRQYTAIAATIKYQKFLHVQKWDYYYGHRRIPSCDVETTKLAQIYSQHTKQSKNIARLIGQIDYEYVLSINRS